MFTVAFHMLLRRSSRHRSRALLLRAGQIIQKGVRDRNKRRLSQLSEQILPLGGRWEATQDMNEETITLNSGYELPRVGLGTWQAKTEEVQAAIDSALESGYRHIDTAFNYLNEEAIGEALKRAFETGKVKREDLFITTKLPHVGNRAGDVAKFLGLSLKRLQLEYVDLYLIHLPFAFLPDSSGEAPLIAEDGSFVLDKDTDHLAIWKALEELVDAGKIRSIGVSNFNIAQMARILKAARIPPAVLQVELHAVFQQRELRKFCGSHNIVVTAYSPLGSPGAKSHFQQKYNYSPTRFPDVMGIPVVKELAEKYSKSPAQILIRHLVQGGIVVIPKSSNPQRIKQNKEIYDFELSGEEMEQLNKIDKGEDGRIFDFLFWKGVQNHPEYPFQIIKDKLVEAEKEAEKEQS